MPPLKKKITVSSKKKRSGPGKDPIPYQAFVENASDIIFNIDKDGYFTYLNPHFYHLTEYSENEAINKHFTTFIAKDYRLKVLFFYKRQLEKNLKDTYSEFPIVTKSGSLVWVGQSVTLLQNKRSKSPTLIAIARDISQRIELQNDIKNTNRRLATLITSLHSGILVEDENRKIIIINENFCKLFGIPVPPHLLVGSDCSESAEQSKMLFSDEEKFVSDIGRILKEKKTVIDELLYLKDGRVFKRDFIPVTADTKYLGHLWKYTDITHSVKVQDAIMKSEEKYRSIINNMRLGLLEVDLNEKIIDANERFCSITGYTKEELKGKNAVSVFLKGGDTELMKSQVEIRKEGRASVYEIELLKKNGEKIWLLISGAPLYDEQNKIIGSIGIHLDITDHKKTEEALEIAKKKAEQSSKAKEAFMANMSHEIRTPLNAIIGMTGLLEETQLSTSQTEYLKAIRLSSDNLMRIVNDVLDFSKIRSGKFSMDRNPISLKKVIEQCVNSMRFAAENKGLELKAITDPILPERVCGDALRLNQVILNLLSNAIKFTEKGRVTITTVLEVKKEKDIIVSIEISDTGIGISGNKQENIFEIFSQEDESVARNYGGTGLGLSITRQLVELMGGTITLKSEKGKGSVFTCSIPFQISEDGWKEKEIRAEPKEMKLLPGYTVLVVEDNELNKRIAVELLHSFGITTLTAENGQIALKLLKASRPDLILMDIQMPGMDGMEVTKIVRNELRLQTPIIAITANALTGDREKYLSAGMNDYLAKPFEKRSFYSILVDNLPLQPDPHSLFSLDKLNELGDPQFVKHIVGVFREQTPELVQLLKKAWLSDNPDELSRVAHQLKSSIDILSINSLKAPVRTVEELCKKNNWKELSKNYVSAIEDVLMKVIETMAIAQ